MNRVAFHIVAGALIATTPVTAAVAAVRPNAAVPTASATAVAAQATAYETRRSSFAETWPIWIFAAAMIGLVAWQIIEDEDEDRPLTRA